MWKLSWPSGYRCSGPAMQASREAQRWAQVGSSRRWPAQRSMFRRAPASASTGQAATHGAAQPSQGAAERRLLLPAVRRRRSGPGTPTRGQSGDAPAPPAVRAAAGRRPGPDAGTATTAAAWRRETPGGNPAAPVPRRRPRRRRARCSDPEDRPARRSTFAWKRAKNAPPPSPTTTAPPAPGSRRSSRRSSPARSRPAWPSGRTMCSPTSPSAARNRVSEARLRRAELIAGGSGPLRVPN